MNKQYEIVDGVAVNKGIGWCTHAWNPLRYRAKVDYDFTTTDGKTWKVPKGSVVNYCQKISPGCFHCYAERLGLRSRSPFFNVPNLSLVEPFIDEKELRAPLGMKVHKAVNIGDGILRHPYPSPHTRPALFPGDMTDLWGDWVPFSLLDRIVAVAALRPDITFFFLSKRSERIVEYFDGCGWLNRRDDIQSVITGMLNAPRADSILPPGKSFERFIDLRPLPNVVLGFSAEDQPNFDARWAYMRKLAAMGWKVFCSYEPAIGPVDFSAALPRNCERCHGSASVPHQHGGGKPCPDCFDNEDGQGSARDRLCLVIPGGESGPRARPFNIQWMRNSIRQCKAAGVALWAKQVGANPVMVAGFAAGNLPHGTLVKMDGLGSQGSDWSLWEPALRVRQLPEIK